MVLEYVTVALNPSVSQENFIELAKKVDTTFLSKQPGYRRHTSWWTKDGLWVDLVEWDSLQEAEAASKSAMENETAAAWFSMMDPQSITQEHRTEAATYNEL